MHEHDVNRISVDTFDRIAARYDARERVVTMCSPGSNGRDVTDLLMIARKSR